MDAKTKANILKAYQTSANSLQDLSRIYNVPLDDVLNLTGNGGLRCLTHLASPRAVAGRLAPR